MVVQQAGPPAGVVVMEVEQAEPPAEVVMVEVESPFVVVVMEQYVEPTAPLVLVMVLEEVSAELVLESAQASCCQ